MSSLAQPSFEHQHNTDCWRTLRQQGQKEWFHFYFHLPGRSLIVNISRTYDLGQEHWQLVLLTQADNNAWSGDSWSLEPKVRVKPGDQHLELEGASITFSENKVRLRLEQNDFYLGCDLTATSESFFARAPLTDSESLSWITTPTWHCTGDARIKGESLELTHSDVYHDHNWGEFSWTGNYSWDWLLLKNQTDAIIMTRITDKSRKHLIFQELYQWRHGELCAIASGQNVQTTQTGNKRKAAPRVPRIMRLSGLTTGASIPERLQLHTTINEEHLVLDVEVENGIELWAPDMASDRYSVFHEYSVSANQWHGLLEVHDHV
jgi:hypothetical protein